jgi:hypothetical protein
MSDDSLERDPWKVNERVAILMSTHQSPRPVQFASLDSPELMFEGERFREHPCEDWLGFYDWLRSTDKEVVGLRLQVDSPECFDLKLLVGLNGVDVDQASNYVTIFFGKSREFEGQFSASQDFGGNRLFIGEKATVALTFRAPYGYS